MIYKFPIVYCNALYNVTFLCEFLIPTSDVWNAKILVILEVRYKKRREVDKLTMSAVFTVDTIYPTPPLGQDMTQGQFLSGV